MKKDTQKDVYVVSALRTPFGSFGSTLAGVSAPELASQVIKALLERNNLDAEKVDEVIIGQVLQGGAAQAPARQAMRKAGLPDSVPAMTINKICGSGLKAMMLAADSIRLGRCGVVVAGGMESMSQSPYALPSSRFGQRLGDGKMLDLLVHDGLWDPYSDRHMGDITDDWAASHNLSREDQDHYAISSYSLAKTAVREGIFDDEIVEVVIPSRKGDVTVSEDEEPFRGSTEKLPTLRPVFNKNGTVTAGNASSINDGAALAILADEEAIEANNLKPVARLVASSSNSIHPDKFAEAPVGAIRKCCEASGLSFDQIGLYEINEAFSSVPLVAIRELGLDPEKVNVNGGAVSIGHPVGASGGRVVATLLREMKRRNEKYGLATLCIGGGEAVAAIFELV